MAAVLLLVFQSLLSVLLAKEKNNINTQMYRADKHIEKALHWFRRPQWQSALLHMTICICQAVSFQLEYYCMFQCCFDEVNVLAVQPCKMGVM